MFELVSLVSYVVQINLEARKFMHATLTYLRASEHFTRKYLLVGWSWQEQERERERQTDRLVLICSNQSASPFLLSLPLFLFLFFSFTNNLFARQECE